MEVTAGKRKAALVEMRSGANDLEIERGRRRRGEVAERGCGECKGEVEYEMHLMLECRANQASYVGTTQRVGSTGALGNEGNGVELHHEGKGYARWRVLGQGVAKMLAEREREKRREERGEETG